MYFFKTSANLAAEWLGDSLSQVATLKLPCVVAVAAAAAAAAATAAAAAAAAAEAAEPEAEAEEVECYGGMLMMMLE